MEDALRDNEFWGNGQQSVADANIWSRTLFMGLPNQLWKSLRKAEGLEAGLGFHFSWAIQGKRHLISLANNPV